MNNCIRILVDVPKPLSSSRTGMVSSITLEVAHRRTPLPKPKKKRPRFISLKSSDSDMIDPIKFKRVNQMIVFLGPVYFTKSPPNRDPALIPIIEEVDRTVM